ncbi:MAG: hypothetical protein ACHREM_09730 [Polyangiales bacterium]
MLRATIALVFLCSAVGCTSATTTGATADASVDASTDVGVETLDGGATPSDAATADTTSTTSEAGDAGPGCGHDGKGTPLHVATNVDLCLPPVVCTSETCPPTLGKCIAGSCQFQGDYAGLRTQPEAWATYYCTLSTGGCHGVTQLEFPEVTAANISASKGLPLCEGATGAGECIGIAASSPMVVGNSQVATDPSTGTTVKDWGLGLTEASGLCYEITGPGGQAIVALTDRCGGYCKCGGSGFQECGPCVSAPDMEPNCGCVGGVPGLYTQCCGRGCATTLADCDWCASNNHPHFDLDTGTFNHLCGSEGVNGSCRITTVRPVSCVTPSGAWPPGGGGGPACKPGSFECTGPTTHFAAVPGTACCCDYDLAPQADGTCK